VSLYTRLPFLDPPICVAGSFLSGTQIRTQPANLARTPILKARDWVNSVSKAWPWGPSKAMTPRPERKSLRCSLSGKSGRKRVNWWAAAICCRGFIITATYLGGGRDFGAFPNATGNFPHIISRNLTPDYTGLGVGDDTFDQFLLIMRTGVDKDHVHPTCTGAPNGSCIPAPFDGGLLQVMSWPTFRNMTDDDLNAIYTYLSSIPCLEGGPGEPANRCTAPAQIKAVADPKNVTVVAGEISLDKSMSTSSDGKPLTYQWTIPRGSPSAAILHGTLATPTAQFSQGRGLYTFLLTVTDSTGRSSSDLAIVNFTGN
jgi:hypothetical protein